VRGRSRRLAAAHLGRGLIGIVAGVLARIWLATLRVRVDVAPGLAATQGRPWVLAFFHGTQWPLLAWRRRRATFVLVSLSLDGSLQASALGVLGFRVVRGSSSRGGLRGLAAMVHGIRRWGGDAAFAVDGPRGPYGIVKGGAALAARASGGVLVPMGSAFARGVTVARAWDRFGIAWPFSRVVVCLGAPLDPAGADDVLRDDLRTAIVAANDVARQLLGELSPARFDAPGGRESAGIRRAGAAAATK